LRRCVSSVLVLVLLVTSVTDLSLHLALADSCTRSSLSSSPGAASTTPTRPPRLEPLFPSLDHHPLVRLVLPRQLFLLSSVSLLLRLHLELLCLCPHPCRASSSPRAGRSDEEDESAEQRVQSKREQVVEELEWKPAVRVLLVSANNELQAKVVAAERQPPLRAATALNLVLAHLALEQLALACSPSPALFRGQRNQHQRRLPPARRLVAPPHLITERPLSPRHEVRPALVYRPSRADDLPTQLHPAREARRGHGEPLSSRHV